MMCIVVLASKYNTMAFIQQKVDGDTVLPVDLCTIYAGEMALTLTLYSSQNGSHIISSLLSPSKYVI
jgi:hypothetical protein